MKKILAAMLSLHLMMSSMSAVSLCGSATVCGDVNGDGSISITDAVCLNQYLNGTLDLGDPTIADTNGNGIVSAVDTLVLVYYLSGKVSSLPYTG